jgi:hypothetical protein
VAEDCIQWWAVVNTVMGGEFLGSFTVGVLCCVEFGSDTRCTCRCEARPIVFTDPDLPTSAAVTAVGKRVKLQT